MSFKGVSSTWHIDHKNIFNQDKISFFSFNLDITLALSDLNLQMTLIFYGNFGGIHAKSSNI